MVTDFTSSVYGYLGLVLFILAYTLVTMENKLQLRKSKPVLFAAGLIWVLVALAYAGIGDTHTAHTAIKASLLEYAELFLFLLAAMTYINALEERNVFQSLRAHLVSRGYSFKTIFWITVPFILHLTRSRQFDNSPAHGSGDHGGGRKKQNLYCHRVHQCHRGGQCRRRFFTFWRHHHPHGMAKGKN